MIEEDWSRPGPIASISLNEAQLDYLLRALAALGGSEDLEEWDTRVRLERALDKLHVCGA